MPTGTTYSAAQVEKALLSSGKERWIWDRLDAAGNYLSDLTQYVENKTTPPNITHDVTQAVHRTMTIRLRGDAPIFSSNILQLDNQIQAHYQIMMPDSSYVDFLLGRFIPVPSASEVSPTRTWQDLTCADYGQLLLDYTFSQATSAPAGASVVASIAALINIPDAKTPIQMQIPDLGYVLVQPITWAAGTSRLKAINDLLSVINYYPAWFDEWGIMRSSPIPDWNLMVPSYTFDSTKAGSIFQAPIKRTADWSNAGNIQDVVVEDPRRGAFKETYKNTNPLSPVSIDRFHAKTLPVIKDSNIPNRAAAQLIAKNACQAAARIFQNWSPTTLAWPLSQDNDVYGFIYSNPDEGLQSILLLELGWSMTCQANGGTTHTYTQLVAA